MKSFVIKIKILLDTAFGSTGGRDQEKTPAQKPQDKGNHTEQSNLLWGIGNKTVRRDFQVVYLCSLLSNTQFITQ